MPTSQSFTITYDGRANVLQTQCLVTEFFDPANPPDPPPPAAVFTGIWDTGASGTAITQSVVDRLGLIATGMTKVNTANGVSDTFTYLVNVALPNGVGFRGVTVSCCTLGPGADLLIGMDIIGSGDFAISSADGKTRMTFRMPSSKAIDFVAEHHEDARRELIKARPSKNRRKKGKR